MRILIVLLALGACSQEPAANRAENAPAAAPMAAPVEQAALISVPKDPAQLKKLEGMGYTVHEDHLHAPGVSTCPKMGDDPIM